MPSHIQRVEKPVNDQVETLGSARNRTGVSSRSTWNFYVRRAVGTSRPPKAQPVLREIDPLHVAFPHAFFTPRAVDRDAALPIRAGIVPLG